MSENDSSDLAGLVVVELRGSDGELKAREEVHNLISDVGDQMYAYGGSGVTGGPAKPTGMKLGTGTGSVAPSKNGAGAALQTYLTGSDLGFDATYPQVSESAGNGATVTYLCTYGAGVATSAAAAITEAVIVNEALANSTSAAAATVSRVALANIPSKQSTDTLTVTWTHTLKGA